jgi:hypothetical protein
MFHPTSNLFERGKEMVNKSCKLWGRTYYADDMFKCGMIDVKLNISEIGDTFHIRSLIPIQYQNRRRNWDIAKMDGTYVLAKIVDNQIFLFYDATTDRMFAVPASLIIQDIVELSGITMREYRLEN